MLNENIIKGKWSQIKGDLQKTWGNITGDEFDQTKGDLTKLGGLIRDKYGQAEEDVRSKLNSIVSRYGEDAEGTVDESGKM